ncbi:MAG TPA: glycosyltransferase [Anaerolineales bacterium]|nr:glycosyltransferase [Anaerolineales bacterium]
MRLLILLPFAPRLDATHGGARVITQFLTEITARHKVAILYFREAEERGADSCFRERCELVEEIVRPASDKTPGARLARYLRLMLSLFLLRPLWVSDWISPAFAKKVRHIAQSFQPEIIQAEFHVMGQYFSALKDIDVPRVLVEYEPSARAALYIQNLPRALHRLIERIEKLSWRRYERKIYRQVDAIVAFTEADQKSIAATAGRTPIHVISPGIAIPEQPLNPVGGLPLSLLFVGNFYHPPNTDAARRLATSIFPSVQKQFPEAKLFLVGENPPADLKRAGSQVIVTGRVPEIMPYLDQAALLVAPVHLGGGMRIKVLEALAAGKAVVTTPLAAEGLDVTDGDQLCIVRTDAEFVERIGQLLRNEEKRLALARRARAWACDHIAWDKSIAKYDVLYKELIGGSDQHEQHSNEVVDHSEFGGLTTRPTLQ